jgi:hypothetical protein
MPLFGVSMNQPAQNRQVPVPKTARVLRPYHYDSVLIGRSIASFSIAYRFGERSGRIEAAGASRLTIFANL